MLQNHTETFVTHSGKFHLDELSAFALLSLRNELADLPQPELTRTRDAALFQPANWLVDVGGIFDPNSFRLDHHQFRSQDPARPVRGNGVAYASAGMMWQTIGMECISLIAKRAFLELNVRNMQAVFGEIDQEIFQPIDAEDNGEIRSEHFYTGNSQQIFPMQDVRLADLIREYNSFASNSRGPDELFQYLGTVLRHFLHARITRTLREEHAREYLQTGTLLESGRILLIADQAPAEIESTLHEVPESVQFAVFRCEGKSDWNIRAIPLEKGSFEFRQGFPPAWRGLLQTASKSNLSFPAAIGNPDAIFCHAGGFLAKAQTEASALSIAKSAVRNG